MRWARRWTEGERARSHDEGLQPARALFACLGFPSPSSLLSNQPQVTSPNPEPENRQPVRRPAHSMLLIVVAVVPFRLQCRLIGVEFSRAQTLVANRYRAL